MVALPDRVISSLELKVQGDNLANARVVKEGQRKTEKRPPGIGEMPHVKPGTAKMAGIKSESALTRIR